MSSAPSDPQPFGGVFRGRRVLVTGHTGFKGAWLCEWLLELGATVAGIGLHPNTEPALFHQLGIENRIQHHRQDIRQGGATAAIIRDFRPDFLFHLAAQPIVRLSYELPVETWETNVLGTIHVLDALRFVNHPCAAIFITTDKCYENREWIYAYREVDPVGGHDPYSSSKAGAEVAIATWRRSFFAPGSDVKIASARAGNVIGGGDWAHDRIVPDCMRALARGEAIPVRNKTATRPWQHVLEPLSGYLWLAALLAGHSIPGPTCDPRLLGDAYNFGPRLESNRTVVQLVAEILKHSPGQWEDRCNPNAPHEASLLNLAIDKAFHLLHWRPVWDFEETVARTIDWYTRTERSLDLPRALTRAQIEAYCAAARAAGLPWAGA